MWPKEEQVNGSGSRGNRTHMDGGVGDGGALVV